MEAASLARWTLCFLLLSLAGVITQLVSKVFVAALLHSRSPGPIVRVGDHSAFFIGYLSGPMNTERRECIRKNCIPALKFLIGQPTENLNQRVSTGQGQLATAWEQNVSNNLTTEARMYGDILPVPYRDLYRDLGDKTLALLQHGKSLGVRNVVKIDDDQCPNVTTLEGIARTTKPDCARYLGGTLWKGTEYKSMTGPDNQTIPYIGGPLYVLSAALVRAILDDPADTVWWFPYGTSSEDKVTGQWFEHAKRRHPELNFSREKTGHLSIRVEGGTGKGFKS